MKLFKISLLILFLALGATATVGYFWWKDSSPGQILINASKTVGISATNRTALEQVLGFESPKTYLLLFLNNTELRPGGGFIGSYAVVRVDKAVPEILKIEGSEVLDKDAVEFVGNPPEPINRWLKVKQWYFRDSNWSPDFALASERALEIYKKENGAAVNEIDAVIGFTPTVIEEFLKIIGPIEAEGMEFNAQNFTEKLEYEVEYGYTVRGEKFNERKNLLADVARALIAKARENIFTRWSKYLALGQRMLAEKQVVVYAVDKTNQDLLRQKNWTGEMSLINSDYLMWVDANLGALKTDASISRNLLYKITTTTSGYLAVASMQYEHTGKYDWRTSRYLSYSRVFVPVGSKLVKVLGTVDSDSQGVLPIGQGVENGRQWFGAYINIAPGTTSTLAFEYLLPEIVARQVMAKQYNLLVQKQIGTNNVGLNLDLNFGKKIINDDGKVLDKYSITKNLSTDKEFKILIFAF